MSDKKEKKEEGGLEALARKALEIANAVAAELRKLKEQLVNEGAISNPASTMSGAEDFRNKKGHVRWQVLVGVLAVFAVITGIVWATETILVRYPAPEGSDAVIELCSDEEDDTADELQMGIKASDNSFFISIGGTDVLTLSSAGTLTTTAIAGGSTNYAGNISLENDESIDNSVDGTIEMTVDDTDEDIVLLLSTEKEDGTASIVFSGDGDDDAGDMFGIVGGGGNLLFQSDASSKGTLATKVTLGSTGIFTLAGGATIDNVSSASVFAIAETTITLTGNATISGTLAQTGVATFTGQDIHNGGIDINEDVDIDFDATDEEFIITSSVNPDGSAGAGMMTLYDSEDANSANSAYLLRLARKNDGGANNEFILCEDNSTGAAGNGDDMFKVDNGGAVTAAGTITSTAGFTLTDADGNATVTATAASGNYDAVLILDADAGEDNADTWTIESEATGNDLSIMNHVTEVLNLTSTGELQIDGDIIVGGGDVKSEAGEKLILTSTIADTTGNGIDIDINASAGKTTGTGGAVDINAGAGAGASQAGGDVELTAGDAGASGNAAGGAVDIDSGAGIGTGNGGAIEVNSGAGGAGVQGDGGAIGVVAGNGGADGDGGSITLTAGNSGGGNEDGGSVTITAGDKNGSGTDGAVILKTGGVLSTKAPSLIVTDEAGTGAGEVTSVSGQALNVEANGAALNIGPADATSVAIGASDITTTVAGPLTFPRYTVLEVTTDALVLTSSHYGTVLMLNTNAAMAITLPAAGAASGAWIEACVVGSDDCVPTFSGAVADTLISQNNQTADSVTFGTGHRIGAYVRFISNGTYWIAVNIGGTTMTVTDG